MSTELTFLAIAIRRAEARLLHQAALVEKLAPGASDLHAVSACNALQSMSQKVAHLRGQKARALSFRALSA